MGETKRIYQIQGLTCANCALKIERELNGLPYIESAVVNSITSKAILELKADIDKELVFKDVDKIASRIEHGVKVKEIDKNHIGKRINPIQGNIKINSNSKSRPKSNTNHVQNSTLESNHDQIRSLENHDQGNNHNHSHATAYSKKKIIKLSIGLIVGFSAALTSGIISLSLFILSYLIIGGDILLIAGKNIIRGQLFDENFLMSIATIGAFAIGEYPEAVGVMLFYQVGEFFQDLAVNKSKKSIADLMDIRPDYANLKLKNGDINVVSPESINVDDIILIKPGEKIPLDGVVVLGSSQIDTSALTGESVPRIIKERDEVLAGSINKTSLIEIKVTKEFGESTVSKILELVENASNKKAPAEKFISKFARWYTPIVVILAIMLAILPPIFVGGEFSTWVYRALSFLVVSCPCALVISIPLSFFGGIGGASRSGILVKGGNYLEALSNAEIVVFDKTGTLTEGSFEVTKILPHGFITEDILIEYAAYAEIYSNHPIAKSIVESYKRLNAKAVIDKTRIKSYDEIAGKGVKIYFGDRYIYAGNYRLMEELEINYIKSNDVGTIVYLAVNNNFVGTLVISDKIKESAPKAIFDLKEIGIKKTVMLTGDNKTIANYVAKVISIDQINSELMPHEKVAEIEKLYKTLSKKGTILFVGDGINDAPVLARADVGIAMGGIGSDAAIEASDVVIMTDNPAKISTAIKIARKTQKIVVQNIVFSLLIKIVVLALAAIGIANMWMAVFADVGVTLLAVLNAMRAMKLED
ncbi:MAG: heavy metal translocating P-type ATPase [Clostridium sp.]|uniref:heavy metal translocating P-type ATPase n=1 Tax=Clostridium sp. TaxID=1506 RepID=UPI002FCCB204